MAGKYTLHRSGSQYHGDLKGGNGEPILSSERYTTKGGAETGIQSCKTNSSQDARYTRLTSSSGQPYFTLKAANGEIIGTSEMYSSTAGRDNGIASCKTNGPTAPTQDNT
jgi:uncharacterized protein